MGLVKNVGKSKEKNTNLLKLAENENYISGKIEPKPDQRIQKLNKPSKNF